MHDLMIRKSPELDRGSLIRYAGELGLDMKKFTASIDSQKHRKEIDRDIKLAEDMNIYNTPTFFINGRKVIGERPFEDFEKIIDEELKKAGR